MVALIVLNVAAYGRNHYTDIKSNTKTIHAERDAISKLPCRKDKKPKKINIVVIKTSKTGILGNSKPCFNCLLDMKDYAPLMGYRINWVYYSDENGRLKKSKLNDLICAPDLYLTSYYRNNNFKHPLLTIVQP